MKLTKTKLKEMIREELLKEDGNPTIDIKTKHGSIIAVSQNGIIIWRGNKSIFGFDRKTFIKVLKAAKKVKFV